MKVPAEFVQLAGLMHQDIHLDYEGEEALVASMIGGLTPEQRTGVKQFLDELLDQDLSTEELNEIWNLTEPSWGFTEDGVRIFLGMVRDALGKSS